MFKSSHTDNYQPNPLLSQMWHFADLVAQGWCQRLSSAGSRVKCLMFGGWNNLDFSLSYILTFSFLQVMVAGINPPHNFFLLSLASPTNTPQWVWVIPPPSLVFHLPQPFSGQWFSTVCWRLIPSLLTKMNYHPTLVCAEKEIFHIDFVFLPVPSGTFSKKKKRNYLWIMFLNLIRFSPRLALIVVVIHQMSKLSAIWPAMKLSFVFN